MNRTRRSAFGRSDSAVKTFIFGVFNLFASPCRLLIEVFIRKNFGERYFRLSSAVATFLMLAAWPMFFVIFSTFSSFYMEDSSFLDIGVVPLIGWYIYLLLFLWKSIQHHKTMKDRPSALDVPRYSLYSGEKLPFLYDIEIAGKKGDPRIIECWLEPAPFFIAGVALVLIGQALGLLLVFCSIVYAVSYRVAYTEADNEILDMIDRKIISEEMANTFLFDKDEKATRGYRFLGRKPDDPEMRKALFDMMTEDNDDAPLAR